MIRYFDIRSAGRSVLFIVALMLVGSALIRVVAGPGAAIARELSQVGSADDPDRPEVADITPELLEILDQTRARERALDERTAEIEARMEVLALIEAEVAEELAKLEQAEQALRATMAAADVAAEDDIARLTSVYENMKADQAAALFEKMEPTFAAGFLGRMRADAAAAIMAGLEPDLAYQISVVLAGRNAEVPREPVPDPLPTQTGNE